MIRFCDREVCCVTESELDRDVLMAYFMNGHRTESVCILNHENQFVGSITYGSLLGHDLEESVMKDYLLLNADIWENGRRYFRSCHQKSYREIELIPVLNLEHQLVCFAWQDDEANREIRMLDELSENTDALGFKDVFPEYDCVEINGCNELAWYFLQYLKVQNVAVRTVGELWRELGIWEDAQALDYKCLTVYAEGLGAKSERVELRDSVSADFECVDQIYEANLCAGLIKDANGTMEELVSYLQGKAVCILGVNQRAADAYDLLLGHGIDIDCFLSENKEFDTLLGKEVRSRAEAEKSADQTIVFIDVNAKYSAWGFGETDFYHYLGYKRNRRFFLLQDYAEVEKKGLLHVIKFIAEKFLDEVVLFGEPGLCLKLYQILNLENRSIRKKIVYCDILAAYAETDIQIPQIMPEKISIKSECLLLLPQYYGCFTDSSRKILYKKSLITKYKEAFYKYNIGRVTEYAFENEAFMEVDEEAYIVAGQKENMVKAGKILLGAIHPFSGNLFFQGILDNHPDIYMISDGYLKSNLFFVCLKLAAEMNDNILSVFWKLYDEMAHGNRSRFISEEKFNQQMENVLSLKKKFTSQEIFVILHIAYARMQGKDIRDASEMIIYWEPHIYSAMAKEHYAIWLKNAADSNYIVNVVRNAFIRAGSMIRLAEINNDFGIELLSGALHFPTEIEEKRYIGWKRVVMRFEDLKCDPKKELKEFCDKTGIRWNDALLDVKTNYNGVTGFDLAPVYRTYEEYFSAFDRFRLSLINGPWQKKYDYPYVSSLEFSRRELKDMFLRKFRFEGKWVFQGDEQEKFFKKWRRDLIRDCLQIVRRVDIMAGS